MSKPVVLEPEAEADLAEAYGWYDSQRAGLGADLLLSIEAALGPLGDRPESFPLIHGRTRRALVRRFPYLVLFVELTDVVSVVGIFHTSQDPKRWADRLR